MPSAPIAVTLGDPAGIGPDVILAAWQLRRECALPPFFVLGGANVLTQRAAQLGLRVPLADIARAAETRAAFAHALPVLPIAEPYPDAVPGQPAPAAAPAIVAAIERGFAMALAGDVSALVTGPIAKYVLAQAGFPHPGHTEFLAALARVAGYPGPAIMMLAAPSLRVVPVTVHVALADAVRSLSAEAIIFAGRAAAAALRQHFGIAAPRIAVCGLNPHAGEHGRMGDEESRIIAPAIAALRAEGLHASGPHSADTLFHAAARAQYDVALGMYHDQVLIPLKTLGFDEGVNVTLGLPIIRTSPDHGTAFDIAGSGLARPDSFCHALRLAGQMARHATAVA